MFARFRRRIGLVGLFAVFLVSGAHGTLANSASTDNCLDAPTSPAPAGSHWFYRVDLESAVKCWYLRMLGQPEQKTSARDRPTTASHTTASHTTASHVTSPHVTASHVAASDVQLIRRPSTSIPGAGSPGLERSTNRDDSASPPPDVGRGASAVAPRSRASVGAPAGETFARTAQDDASSPSIELIRVRNSNELQVGDQAAGPRPPVRVVWPIPVSEVQPAEVSKADAKEQSARMVSPEADAAVNAGTESAARAWRRSGGIFAHGAIGGAYFSLVWASRRRHFSMGGDEGGQYTRRAISWNPSPRNRSRRPALREQAPRTRPG